MNITPKFGLLAVNKLEKEQVVEKRMNLTSNPLNSSETDTFISGNAPRKNAVSFRGGTPNPNKILEMLKSNAYFKILGATIVATATALWTQLKEAGIKEEDITEEDITKMLTSSVDDVLKEKKGEVLVEEKQSDEKIIEAEVAEPVESTKKRGRPKGSKNKVKTVKLSEEKQPDEKNAKRKYEENVRIVTELAKDGKLSQIEISRISGIRELTVSRIVRKYNLPTPKRNRKANISEVSTEKILEIFEQNKFSTKKDVASILGLSEVALDKLCEERGIANFVRVKNAEKLDKESLEKDFSEGLTTQEIAQKYNVKINIIRKAYRDFGIENPNRKERSFIDEKTIAEIKQRRENNESTESIAQDMGLSLITVERIARGHNSTFVLELKKMAQEGASLEEASKQTGKPIKTIRQLATRYGIKFSEKAGSKVNIQNDKLKRGLVDRAKIGKFLNKFNEKQLSQVTPDNLFFIFPRIEVELSEESKELIARLKKSYKKEIDIINKLDNAKTLKDIQDCMKGGSRTVIRYSNEDLMNRYLAKSYALLKAKDNDKSIRAFIDKTTVPRIILNKENVDFIKDVWRFKDTEVPENDPLFEEYKACFNKRATEFQIEVLKHNYKKSIMNELVNSECLQIIQQENSPYVEITAQVLFNLIFSEQKVQAKAIIPEFITSYESADEIQKEIIDTINLFKKKEFVKEYVDLVLFYNANYAENYEPEQAKRFLSELINVSKSEKIEKSDLRNLINNYKSGNVVQDDKSATKQQEVVDYSVLSLEELKMALDELYEKLPEGTSEEFQMRALDFTTYANDQDIDTLREFLVILNSVINGELSDKEAIDKCVSEGISPLEGGIDDWLLQKEISQMKSDNDRLYREILDLLHADKYKFIQALQGDINAMATMDIRQLGELNKNLYKIYSMVNEPEALEHYLDGIINKKLVSGQTATGDKLKNFVLDFAKTLKYRSAPEFALKCLDKIDEYNSLPYEEQNLIANVLEIFDDEDSEIEKALVIEIVNNRCLKNDSVIYNKAYDKDVIITKELKQELLNKYQGAYFLLKWFEEAAALKATKKSSCGIKDLTINNKDPKYSMEIKILNKNFGQIRLLSTFEMDEKGRLIKKDKNGNLIKNFRFTKLDTSHREMGK